MRQCASRWLTLHAQQPMSPGRPLWNRPLRLLPLPLVLNPVGRVFLPWLTTLERFVPSSRTKSRRFRTRSSAPQPGQTFRLELFAEVKADPAVKQAVLKRQLMLEHYPGCDAAQAIKALASKLLG